MSCMPFHSFPEMMYHPYVNNPMMFTMFHGTTLVNALNIGNTGFIPSPDGMLGPGVYVSRDYEKACRYPVVSYGEPLAVLQLIVNVGRVIRIDYQGHPLQKTWPLYGFNTAWLPSNCGMVDSGLEEDCIYDPRQIIVLGIIPNHRNCCHATS